MGYEEKLKKSLSALPPDERLALVQQWGNLAVALCRAKKMNSFEMKLMGISPNPIDAEVFCA